MAKLILINRWDTVKWPTSKVSIVVYSITEENLISRLLEAVGCFCYSKRAFETNKVDMVSTVLIDTKCIHCLAYFDNSFAAAKLTSPVAIV